MSVRILKLAWRFTFLLFLIGGLTEGGFRLLGKKPVWKYMRPPMKDDVVHRYQFQPGNYKDQFGVKDLRINSLGTRGPEPKNPVLLSIGDSCTFGVNLKEEETFPMLLSRNGGRDVINAGLPGSNSFHGQSWLERSDILSLKPKLVTIYYGWNDHWYAFLPERVFSWIRQAAVHSVVFSELLRFQVTFWSQDEGISDYFFFPQVPQWEFRDNLRRIVKLVKTSGALPILITGPSEPRLINNGKWFTFHRLFEFELHEEYLTIIREVAKETGAILIDMDARVKQIASPSPWDLFSDFVHLNAFGQEVLAEELRPWFECAENNSCRTATPEVLADRSL